ncbi:hypothetical protein BME96_15710 [Virgibacillus halodenitrificans]|uniref:DUF624 domain-containing protein n=1 Tax=Virgibacillus halodenitrificans TaxID=1482 RepID=A0AAC9NLI0_VIRHA|nr:DUF624 domain-containing protein [Virgibacillus halodenitrificans]APC49552.1 hypothetical protein BME96_15710 [Virgibacillus halodenitrificans]CDQ31295.1 putative integral membrane protein [Virgibacillus halodenitrificans]
MGNEKPIIYQLSEWFMRLSITNIAWFISNLPIAYLLLNFVYAETKESRYILAIGILLLAPFLFFPATSALFAMVRDWILKKEQCSLIKTYFTYFRKNYCFSLLGGLLLTGIWAILVIDFIYVRQINVLLLFCILGLGVVIYIFTINFFIVLVHYDEKLTVLMKKAFVLTLVSPKLFFIHLFASSGILYISIGGWLVLLPFFTAALIAFISYSAFYRIYLNVLDMKNSPI